MTDETVPSECDVFIRNCQESILMKNDLQSIYDEFAKTYEENRGLFDMSAVLDDFYSGLEQKKGKLLDLGCGAGEPVARYFVDRNWSVTGVDFSEKMIELVSKYVPEMQSIHADMNAVKFEPNQFNAITACYSLFHIPANTHAVLFEKMYRWLQPNGKVLFTYATEEYTGSEEFNGYKTFMDRELFYSHKKPDELLRDVEKTGFSIDSTAYRNIGGEIFLWVTARK